MLSTSAADPGSGTAAAEALTDEVGLPEAVELVVGVLVWL